MSEEEAQDDVRRKNNTASGSEKGIVLCAFYDIFRALFNNDV